MHIKDCIRTQRDLLNKDLNINKAKSKNINGRC
jgi:hypothetical protein